MEQWIASAAESTGHCGAPRTLLLDGRVFVTCGGLGGVFQNGTVKSEIYDPSSDLWFSAADFPGANRSFFGICTLLDGRVLMLGGVTTGGAGAKVFTLFSESWLYDPAHNSWAQSGNLPLFGNPIQVAVLQDGRVLACGQVTSPTQPITGTSFPASQSSFIYDPATGSWDFTRDAQGNITQMNVGHAKTTLIVLPDGRAAIVAGHLSEPQDTQFTNIVDVFDPRTGLWTAFQMPAIVGEDVSSNGERGIPQAALLHDGRLLICGGEYVLSPGVLAVRASTLLWNPATGLFTLGPSMNSARAGGAARTLNDGRVLVMAGYDVNFVPGVRCEVYQPATNTFAETAALPTNKTDGKTGAAQSTFAPQTLACLMESAVLHTGNGNVLLAPSQAVNGNQFKGTFTYLVGQFTAQQAPANPYDPVAALANQALMLVDGL